MKTFIVIVIILIVLFVIKFFMKLAWRAFWILAVLGVAAYLITKYLI